MLFLPLAFFVKHVVCSFHPLLFSLGTHIQQGIRGDKSSTIASEELNDSVLSKDPEGGGLLLSEPSYSAIMLFFCLNLFKLIASLGENCEGDVETESLSDINDVRMLFQ